MSLSKNLLESLSNRPGEISQWFANERRKAAARELRLVDGVDNVDTHAVALLDDFGHATDATSLLLAHQSCPPEFRAFIDAVIGAVRISSKKADSAGYVEVDDKTLAKRAGRSTKWVQQHRNDLRAWQHKHDVALIDIRDHYREPDGTPHPHAYKIHIDRLAVDTVIEARRTPGWNSDPNAAMEATARRISDSAPTFHPRKQKKRRKRSDAEIMESKYKQAAKLLGEIATLGEHNEARPGEATIHSLLENMDKVWVALTGNPVEQVSSQYSSNRVENGGVVEKSSPRIDPTESTTYENRETQPGGVSVEMAVEAARAFDVAEFQVTMLDDEQPKGGKPESFEQLSKDDFEKWLPSLLRRNAEKSESLIVRPVASNLIQIDDCDSVMLERLQPFSLLSFETSADNYQAILALLRDTEKPERDAVRRRLLAQFQKADRSASGAMRWPGSLNHKQGRNKFVVRLCAAHPGRCATVAELEAANMLAPVPPPSQPARPERQRAARAPLSWPDYERCVRGAPKKKSGEPDLSIADKDWSILALDRGWPDAEVEAMLCELRDKAKRRPEYARKTVAYAASVVNSRV